MIYSFSINDLLTALNLYDDIISCIEENCPSENSTKTSVNVNPIGNERQTNTIFSLIKQMIVRGCEILKNIQQLKAKGTLKRQLQSNPNLDLGTVEIEEIAFFLISYLKDLKPKLLSKTDVDLFNAIKSDSHSKQSKDSKEMKEIKEFFDSKEETSRNLLLSVFLLLKSYLLNGKEFFFEIEDAITFLLLCSDQTFRKKCVDKSKYELIFNSLDYILPLYSPKKLPMTLTSIQLMNEPIRTIFSLSEKKQLILMKKQFIIMDENKESNNSISLPHDYLHVCYNKKRVFIANKQNISVVGKKETLTIDTDEVLGMVLQDNLLLVAYKHRIDFIDIETMKTTVSHDGFENQRIKVSKTKDGFVVIVNNNQIILYNEIGKEIQRKNINFESKEVTCIENYESSLFIGFTDGNIMILDNKSLNEKEIIICHEGSIKKIDIHRYYTFVLTSNNVILVIENQHYQIMSLFTPLAMATSLILIDHRHLLVGTTNSLLKYHLNNFHSCCEIHFPSFYNDIPQCMSTLNHSFTKNIHQIQKLCCICEKKLSHDDLCCRHCHISIHCHCLIHLTTDCQTKLNKTIVVKK